MEDLYDIFLSNIIDEKDVNDRASDYKERSLELEAKLIDSLTTEQKANFLEFKYFYKSHMDRLRIEDCERVLALAMHFNRLIDKKLDIIKSEDGRISRKEFAQMIINMSKDLPDEK